MTLEDICKALEFHPVPDMQYPSWPNSTSNKSMEEYNEACDKAFKNRDATLRPGAILRLKSGELRLVGHVNVNLGVCDDCTDFEYEDIAEIAYLY